LKNLPPACYPSNTSVAGGIFHPSFQFVLVLLLDFFTQDKSGRELTETWHTTCHGAPMRGRSRQFKAETGFLRLEVGWEKRATVWRARISPSRVGRMAGFGEENILCALTPAPISPQLFECRHPGLPSVSGSRSGLRAF
jgi:hypothetical protein